MLAIIGSYAFNYATKGCRRKPQDLDLVGPYDEIMKFAKGCGDIKSCYPTNEGKKLVVKYREPQKGIQTIGYWGILEAELAWPGSSAAALLELIETDPQTHRGIVTDMAYASLDVLYMLKMSHRYLKNSPHFLKTMEDIHKMRAYGATIRPEHQAFYEQRMKDTYVYAHPKLNVDKADFFSGDGVNYVYDHDSIHEAIKFADVPAYSHFSDGPVKVSKTKWDALDDTIKLRSVVEEATVLALERSQIPYRGQITPRASYKIALMKVCTSITSGWWREYAWENYYRALDHWIPNYVEIFDAKLKEGVVHGHQSKESQTHFKAAA